MPVLQKENDVEREPEFVEAFPSEKREEQKVDKVAERFANMKMEEHQKNIADGDSVLDLFERREREEKRRKMQMLKRKKEQAE